jgi:hypothetical protein
MISLSPSVGQDLDLRRNNSSVSEPQQFEKSFKLITQACRGI